MPRGSSMLGALFFVIAAVLLYTSLPLGWGAGDVADGTRYKLSPIQLSHVLQPGQPVSTTEDCAIHGPAKRCRIGTGGASAFGKLQLVRPLTLAGAAVCMLAAVLLFLDRLPFVLRLAAGAGAAIIPAASMMLFSATAKPALEALTDTSFGLAATKGTMQLILAIALALGGTGLMLRPRLAGGRRFATLAAFLILPFVGLRFLGWPGLALAYGLGLLIFITLSASRESLPETSS